MTRRLCFVIAALGFVVAAAACRGNEDDSDDAAVEDRDEWCAIVRDVDEQFEHSDTSGDDFRVRQTEYAEIKTQLDRLASNLELVDAGVREDIGASLAFAANVTTAYTTATDEAAAGDALQVLFEDLEEDTALPGSDWILENCDVDIDG